MPATALGTDGWEVLYILGGRVHQVYPPGDWPIETWEQELLGYAPWEQRHAEEEARVARETGQQTDEEGPASIA